MTLEIENIHVSKADTEASAWLRIIHLQNQTYKAQIAETRTGREQDMHTKRSMTVMSASTSPGFTNMDAHMPDVEAVL